MFTSTFRCVQVSTSIEQCVKDSKPAEETRNLVSLQPSLDKDNLSLWEGAPNGVIQLGKLPPQQAMLFSVGQKYRITIEPVQE